MKHSEINIKSVWLDIIGRHESKQVRDEVTLALLHYLRYEEEPEFRNFESDLLWGLLKIAINPTMIRRRNGRKGGAPKENKNNRYSKQEYNLSTTKVQPKYNLEYNQSTTKVQPKVQPEHTDYQQLIDIIEKSVDLENRKETEKAETFPHTPIVEEKEKEKNKEKKNSDEFEEKPTATKTAKSIRVMNAQQAREWLKEKIQEHAGKYDSEMLNNFYRYWTEPVNEDDPKTKLKFQLQKTWQTRGRLVTWYSHNK